MAVSEGILEKLFFGDVMLDILFIMVDRSEQSIIVLSLDHSKLLCTLY